MFLDRIVATKRTEVDALKQRTKLADLERTIAGLPACRGFEQALTARRRRSLGLIAEVKKASPSKGLIREDFDPAALAAAYERAGADCVSVLTDESYFQGSNAFLQAVKREVSLPILRKDFTIDPMQVYEARAIGADAVLLIAAILDQPLLKQLLQEAKALGLDVLVEVHDRAEMERALQLDHALIGVNNRNLHTFVTDLKTTEELIAMVPQGVHLISESGISGRGDVEYLSSLGVSGLLIGEHFMRKPDVEAAVRELLGPLARTGA